MALPLLAGGADCGPSNPLQGLSKRFDQDRGLQQDYFGPGRAGSFHQTFRSQPLNAATTRAADEATHFFSDNITTSQTSHATPYNVSELQAALPSMPIQASVQSPQMQRPLAGWASEFSKVQTVSPLVSNLMGPAQTSGSSAAPQTSYQGFGNMHGNTHWTPSLMRPLMNPIPHPTFAPEPQAVDHGSLWDKEFSAQELVSRNQMSEESRIDSIQTGEPDELARTAGLLLETVQHENNPKFQNSQFLGLMKQLRDGAVVVEGNQMVESSSVQKTDVKGKGRAFTEGMSIAAPNLQRGQDLSSVNLTAVQDEGNTNTSLESENDAYFRQENVDYARYWNEPRAQSLSQAHEDERAAWDQLQGSWDEFEATSTGIKRLQNYQFQENNPYVLGQQSSHSTYTNHHGSFAESILELEAAVQADPKNAAAWFALGVKQQENEREGKALQALERAADLDPTHLPTWLALAVSHTNDNNRLATYSAVEEWVSRNESYRSFLGPLSSNSEMGASVPATKRYNNLVECLMSMARSSVAGQIDADVQIALAVILNSNEDYERAQDCFRTALAVRPEDWLLYNRVGATMANSGRAEEALQFYYRALELNPGYIRARFNLGISCINLRRYEEATHHILDALMLQENDGAEDKTGYNDARGVTSNALWDSLKTTCLHMQRVDLATLCDRQDLALFRESLQ